MRPSYRRHPRRSVLRNTTERRMHIDWISNPVGLRRERRGALAWAEVDSPMGFRRSTAVSLMFGEEIIFVYLFILKPVKTTKSRKVIVYPHTLHF